jgi:hypothetical protein
MASDATLIPMAAAAAAAPIGPIPAWAAAPVTAAEAEALARRIRVESKIPRLALVGTTLGIVFGVAAIWPFTDSGGFMGDALLSGSGVFAFAPGWLLAGLLPLVAFYAGRLHVQSRNATTRELETSLRKIRRLIFWSMLASAAAFIGVSVTSRSGYDPSGVSWMPLLYVACFAACATIVGDVRRGLGDFDSEHLRRRRRLVRGFQVELAPTASPAAHEPGHGNHENESDDGDDIPLATAVAMPQLPLPPPLPSQRPLPPRALAVPFERGGEDEHSKDLRLLLTLAVVVGICVHAVRVGEVFSGINGHAAVSFFERVTTASGSLSGVSLILAVNLLGAYLLVPCALLWILWGVSALNYGPGVRPAAVSLAAITLVLAGAVVLPWWVLGVPEDALPGGFSALAGRLARAPEIVHAALILLLLTRPGIRSLFAKSSEMGDES